MNTGTYCPGERPKVSVIIKALDEDAKIARAIGSAFEASKGMTCEVIVADSLSNDRTVEIALSAGAKVVQLERADDRGCGSAVQLGYQYSRGEFIYVLDADMVLQPDFLRCAIKMIESDSRLAGVGGTLQDTHIRNAEDRARAKERKTIGVGRQEWLDSGGLYRRTAIEAVEYLGNRNLKAFEEAELGMRLTGAGWGLVRLPVLAVEHTGRDASTLQMLRRHWQSGRAFAGGAFLRSAIGKGYFWRVVRLLAHPLMVGGAWVAVGVLAVFSLELALLVAGASFGAAFVLLAARKRNVAAAIYSLLHWHYGLFGILRGVLLPQDDPRQPISSRVAGPAPRARGASLHAE